ncbi:PREDICTED: uncharacterized protein LOC106748772 isoform X2 [Dinoponera quadriceps]|nr:PREDICTED: uncharacterized protein LOC106748772 isoform X2 [Dinoponera quadriceps]XP_014483118.1 PREDICTED: uncharacterized protein LOC106748772 isoform X2 [Dinoponera quadriceps]
MARVVVYERVVDAVQTKIHIGQTSNIDIQNGIKIKEEPVDAVMDINATNDYKLLRSHSKLFEGDKSLLSENETQRKHVNHKTKKCVRDDYSEDSDSTKLIKIINLKRKITRIMRDTSPITIKKPKYSDKIVTNDHTYVSKTKIQNLNRKKDRRLIASKTVTTTKTQHINTAEKNIRQCEICFMIFKNYRSLNLHRLYFMKIGNFLCRSCKKYFPTQGLLYSHSASCRKEYDYSHQHDLLHCNYCSRQFKKKGVLQSHLFHLHMELISPNNVTETKNSKIVPESISCKYNTSRNDLHEETPCPSNFDKPKELSTMLINKNCKQSRNSFDDTTKIDKLVEEEPSNEEMPPRKKLRQLTLNECIEFCKRKHDVKINQKKLNITEGSCSSTCASSHDEQVGENRKPKLSEEAVHNGQVDTSTKISNNNLGQVTNVSTLAQSEKHGECPTKEPFVKLHAKVETMKCFLESLADTNIKSELAENQTNSTVSHEHSIPYSLRPMRAIRFSGDLGSKLLRKSSLNSKSSIETKQNVISLDKVNSGSSTSRNHSSFKDCSITLKRCDEKVENHDPISTVQTTSEQKLVSTITEPKSAQSQKSSTSNNVVLKKLEVSLERLKTEADEDSPELEKDAETQDNCFSCGICKKSFPTKLMKRAHIKSYHIAYMSSICNARYTMKHKLLQHYLREHTFKLNECCVCNELLLDSTELKQHLNFHCLKYLQNKNDQYPINIDIKCSTKGTFKCIKCDEKFSSYFLWSEHGRYCPNMIVIDKEVKEVQENPTKEANVSSEVILQADHKEDAHESTVKHDERIQHDASPELLDNKPLENANKNQVTSTDEELRSNEEEPEIIIQDSSIIEEDLRINENEKDSFSRKAIFIVENVRSVNKSQELIKLPETNNPTIINDQNIASVQPNRITESGKTYPCDICGKRFQNKKNLEQHIRSYSRVNVFCPLCNTAFSSKRFLQTHIAAAHVPQLSRNYNFHCVFCNQGFTKKYELRPHVLHLHGRQMLEAIMPNFPDNQGKEEPDNGNATCTVCNLAFETLDRYVEHTMYYYKDHKFTCTICLKDFQGMYMYHHHNKLTHYSEDKRKSYIYTCNICNEGFNHELHFYSHNMHVHSKKESSTDIAGQRAENNQPVINVEEEGEVIDLSTNQQKKVELLSPEFICQICQLQCTDADDLKSHELFYTNDGDFKCNLCSRRCKTLDLLNQHKSLTHICRDVYNEYMCPNCEEILPSVTSLKCHEKHFHVNLVSCDNANNCKNCSQTFFSSTEYKEHQCKPTSSKTKEKYIYRCFYCDMKFLSLDMIQAHIIQIHFGKLLAKHIASKAELPTVVSDDKIQKKSIPQLVDQVLLSRKNLSQSFPQSDKSPNNTSTTQETQDRVVVEPTPDQLKALFLIDVDKQTAPNESEAVISTTMEKEQNNQSKADTPFRTSTGSTNHSNPKKHHKQFLSDSFNISLEQMLDGHSIFSSTESAKKSKVTFTSVPSKPVTGSNIPIAVAPIPRNEEVQLQNHVSVNNNTDYTCPLCPLRYPSLMYFHAHLRYIHSDVIRNDLVYPQLDQLTEKIPAIECLLCPHISTNEKRYKRHLRYSHSPHKYFMNFKETKKISNASISSNGRTVISESPEVITVEDDDDNIKSTLVGPTTAKTAVEETTRIPNVENENIGKLKVKPFAKIIENLTIDREMELLKGSH